MLRGHAHATFTALNLHDSLVHELQTKISRKSWRSSFVAISQHYLPAHSERDNKELITHVARRPGGALGVVQVQLSARPRSQSMLVEVSGPCGTASNTLRPKRLPIHIV
jgi:hypothetical protein